MLMYTPISQPKIKYSAQKSLIYVSAIKQKKINLETILTVINLLKKKNNQFKNNVKI